MSIASLFAPNDYVLYAKNLITDGNPAGNVPSMTVVKTTGVLITQGAAVLTGTVRSTPPANVMVVSGVFGTFVTTGGNSYTVDTTVVSTAQGNLVTVRIPQFTLATITTPSATISIGTTLIPAYPIIYVPPEATSIAVPINSATGTLTTGLCSVTNTAPGIINLVLDSGANFANGCGLTADIVFSWTF